MAKYRKTALIEAHPMGVEGFCPEWFSEAFKAQRISAKNGVWTVVTAEGPLEAKPGDWVAHNPDNGDIWPIARETFEKTYELAE